MQLAGCSVAALGWSIKSEDCTPRHYGYSIAYKDVLDLREKYEELLNKVGDLEEKAWRYDELTK